MSPAIAEHEENVIKEFKISILRIHLVSGQVIAVNSDEIPGNLEELQDKVLRTPLGSVSFERTYRAKDERGNLTQEYNVTKYVVNNNSVAYTELT